MNRTASQTGTTPATPDDFRPSFACARSPEHIDRDVQDLVEQAVGDAMRYDTAQAAELYKRLAHALYELHEEAKARLIEERGSAMTSPLFSALT